MRWIRAAESRPGADPDCACSFAGAAAIAISSAAAAIIVTVRQAGGFMVALMILPRDVTLPP